MRNKELTYRLLQFIKPYKKRLIVAMFSMVMVSAFGSAQAYIVKPLLDEMFVNKREEMLNLLPLALIAVYFMKGIFYYTYTSTLDTIGQSIIRDMREKIFSHIHSLPISFFHHTPTGELIARVVNDATLIQRAVSRAIVGTLKDLIQVFGLLFVVFYLNWKLALVSLIFMPIAIVPVIHFGKKLRRISITNQQTVAEVTNILHETITGHRIVKAFGMEQYEIDKFSKIINRLLQVIIKDILINSLQHPLMELLGGCIIAGIIWYGGHQVLNGQSTPGTFIAFFTTLIMIYEPIKNISNINSPIQQGLAASTRIFNLLDIEAEIQDKPNAITPPIFHDKIELHNVHFSYDGKNPVLSDINITAKAGEIIALVGTSGGGKSTLLNLLPRFYEVSRGKILIDGNDIRDVSMKWLRDQMAIVTQQTILFNDTVRNNIAYGDPTRPDEEIAAAARAAHALDFICELPDGFDTVIGESGARLSGGQQQRISIARALLKNAPILILDEATSALDTESEREVQKALENLMKNRTTFVIAHRLSTITHADRILVLQDGKITEEGSHDELMAMNGTYTMLRNMQ